MLAALALAVASPVAARVDAVARRAGLAGEVLVAKGDRVLLDRGYGSIKPGGGARHRAGERWRLASITKQVVAVAIMREVQRGRLFLDQPLGYRHNPLSDQLTVRMLLQHHSGLANPDDSPTQAGEMPNFYRASSRREERAVRFAYCRMLPGKPNSPFAYNNCDYLVLGSLLHGAPLAGRYGGATLPGYVGGKPEPRFNLATFGAAGALTGTAREVFRFDRRLMTGKLLKPAALAELWKPEGNGSYQALGQWVFPGRLKGCAAAKRIVQRDGEIGGVQARNFIFPDDDLVVIVFTNRSSDDFKLGEVWEGKGFVYDLLSAAACG